MAEKFLNDMYDWQRKSGCLPQIAPSGGTDFYMYTMNGSVGWADAGILMPYVLWKQYGDASILSRRYDGMKRYAKFMMGRCSKWGGSYAKPVKIPGEYKKYLVNRGQSYGEWAEPQDIYTMRFMDFAGPHPEVSTAYTAYMMDLMAEIAGVLGHDEDIPQFLQYANTDTPTWLGTLYACGAVGEMVADLERAGKRHAVITGVVEGSDDAAQAEIEDWCRAAQVRRRFRDTNLAQIGRSYPGMMDLYIDETNLYHRMWLYTDAQMHLLEQRFGVKARTGFLK